MSAQQRLAAANIQRSTDRQVREVSPLSSGVTQGRVVSVDSNGVTIATENGGRITVPRSNDDAQGVTPNIGSVYQATVTGGVAKLNISSRIQPAPPSQVTESGIIVADRAPTLDDKGNKSRPWWVNVAKDPSGGLFQADLYLWTGATDGYAKVSGASESNGYIESPAQGNAYPIVPSATFSSVVKSLCITIGGTTNRTFTNGADTVTIGGTTVELNIAIGGVLRVNQALTLTPTATDGTAISFTIGYG